MSPSEEFIRTHGVQFLSHPARQNSVKGDKGDKGEKSEKKEKGEKDFV